MQCPNLAPLTPCAGVDIIEHGSRAQKHSSGSEQEVLGLLDCAPSPGGRVQRSNGQHARHVQQGPDALPQRGEHEHISSDGVHERGAASIAGSDLYPLDLQKQDSGAAAADGRLSGGSNAWRRHRDSSGSLVFEVEPPGAADGSLLARQGSGRAGGLRSVSFITAMLMGVALCFHSLLEGAAMGAQPTIRCGDWVQAWPAC